MSFELITIPCLSDNYAFLAHDEESNKTLLVDVPEAAPIQKVLDQTGWELTDVILTHHHADHVQGLDALCRSHPARIIGAAADQHRLPPLDLAVSEGDFIEIGSQRGEVFDVSGHTLGHIAVYFKSAKILFTADSLMALGCGRLFEGSPPQMWESLSKLSALDPECLVCSGHEYTAANARFALTIEPQNTELQRRAQSISDRRAQNLPTVPSTLGEELSTNPFLRPDSLDIRNNLRMQNATDAQVFAEIRSRKDKF
ncbi:MAG: hydroxyacylglutathione hydrolase [Paracoccaceae bacterium]